MGARPIQDFCPSHDLYVNFEAYLNDCQNICLLTLKKRCLFPVHYPSRSFSDSKSNPIWRICKGKLFLILGTGTVIRLYIISTLQLICTAQRKRTYMQVCKCVLVSNLKSDGIT